MEFSGFDWDEGNRAKCLKHGVSRKVIEEMFSRPVVVLPDSAHSTVERRYRVIGRAGDGRHVFIVFTLRRHGGNFIRPISARYMHAKEVKAYEKENPDLQE